MTRAEYAAGFILIGMAMVSTPFIIGGFGQDMMDILMQRLDFRRLTLMRWLMLSGFMFLILGVALL